MTTPPPNVQAALATLRDRLGGAAPRWGVARPDRAQPGRAEVVGALAIAPRPSDDPEDLPGVPGVLGVPNRQSGPSVTPDRAIPTGFRALDEILGLGGLPLAATTSLHGDGTSGKTTLALQAVAQAQAAGGIVAYLDLAGSLDPVEAVTRGVQLDWLVVLTPDSLEEALAMAAMLLQDRTVDLLLLDLQSRSMEGAGIPASKLADRFGRLAAMARRAGVQLLVLEPPSLPSALAGALSQVAALRLELSRRAWIRLGRDVVGQRTEVRVARDRFGPPGRAAELLILYAEGGLRDACLARGELLREAADGVRRPAESVEATRWLLAGVAPPGAVGPAAPSRAVRSPLPLTPHQLFPVSVDATPPSLLAPPSPSPGLQPVLFAVRGGADRPGRETLDERPGPGREPVGAGTGRPARNAAGSGSSACPGGPVSRSGSGR
jgi:recombination protein RecA